MVHYNLSRVATMAGKDGKAVKAGKRMFLKNWAGKARKG